MIETNCSRNRKQSHDTGATGEGAKRRRRPAKKKQQQPPPTRRIIPTGPEP